MRGLLLFALTFSITNTLANNRIEVSIDYITIAVKDLSKTATLFSKKGFTLKKPHLYKTGPQAGLMTQSIRFKNSQYLQLVSPINDKGKLSQWYLRFLKNSEGAATLVLRRSKLEVLEKKLKKLKLACQYSKNKGHDWLSFKTDSPFQHLSFIDYKNQIQLPEELFQHKNQVFSFEKLVLTLQGDPVAWANIFTKAQARGIGLEISSTSYNSAVFVKELYLLTTKKPLPKPFSIGGTKISFKSE